jgi:DNA-binding LacI/PurR family transcriptional regulator
MNLEDVARRAGVSTATVSRVLNNIGVVRKATRTKVLKAADELKYAPNLHARALAGAGRTIGLIVSNLENPFFLDIFHHLDQGAHELGYEVLIANTAYDPGRLHSSIQLMLGRRPTGLGIVVSELDAAVLDELSERKIRTVAYDATGERPGVTNIRTDYKRGMQRAAEYLYSLGHRRMAFVGHHSALGPLNDRRQAFMEAMQRFDGVEQATVANEDSYAGGRAAVKEILERGFRPTAIICVNDFMAVGVLRQLREAGLRVPEDVSVSGFDNISLSEVSAPSLTTLHIPRDLIGRQILERLVGGQELSAEEIVIEPELLVRESTGRAPASL